MIRGRFVYKFIPIFIGLYFIVSLLPKLDFLRMEAAFFPISPFDLYSIVPNKFLDYELLLDKDSENERYLYFKNPSLDEIETKFYRSWIRKIGMNYEGSGEIDFEEIKETLGVDMLKDIQSIHLVKLTGRYSEWIRDDDYDLYILKEIK